MSDRRVVVVCQDSDLGLELAEAVRSELARGRYQVDLVHGSDPDLSEASIVHVADGEDVTAAIARARVVARRARSVFVTRGSPLFDPHADSSITAEDLDDSWRLKSDGLDVAAVVTLPVPRAFLGQTLRLHLPPFRLLGHAPVFGMDVDDGASDNGAWIDGDWVPLTRQQHRLLALLVRRRPSLVTFGHLMEETGTGSKDPHHMIAETVRTIRRRLWPGGGRPGHADYIRNERDVGYSFWDGEACL